MPTPRKLRRQVTRAPLPGVRRQQQPIARTGTPQLRVSSDPEAFGAGLGRTVQQIGSAFHSEALAQQEQELARQNDTRVRQALRRTQEWEIANLYDPERGALQRRGEAALNLGAEVRDGWDKFAGEILSGLGNDRQREILGPILEERRGQILVSVLRHEATEVDALRIREIEGSLANAQTLAAANSQDPARVADELANVREAALALTDIQGLGPEAAEEFITGAESGFHRGIVEQLLADRQDLMARNYYENWEEHILGADRQQLAGKLRAGSIAGESQRRALEILADATEDTTLSSLLEQVDQIADPEVRDATEARVRTRHSILQAEAAARIDQAGKDAKAQIDAIKGDITNILRRNPGATPRDLIDPRILDQLPLEDQRAVFNLVDTFAPGKPKIVTDPATYNRLRLMAANDPEKFIGQRMTRFVDKLDETDWQQMVDLQANIIEGNRTAAERELDGIRSTERIINGSLMDVGIDPRAPENRRAVDKLWESVDAQVRQLQQMTGKPATDADIQEIVDSLMMERYIEKPVEGSWWGFLPFVPFFDQPGRQAVDVTVEEILRTEDVTLIPLPERRTIEETLRRNNRPVSDEAVLELYIQTQQRLRAK